MRALTADLAVLNLSLSAKKENRKFVLYLPFNPNPSVFACTPTQLRFGDYSNGASPMVKEYVSDPLF